MSDHNLDNSNQKQVKKSESLWLMSFSDMSLVLLCFFALMVSTMSPNKKKFDHIKEALDKEQRQKESLKTVSEKLKKVLKQKNLSSASSVEYDAEGLHIEFHDGLIFKSGSSKVNRKLYKVIRKVLKTIAKVGDQYNLIIEGHTDDSPMGKKSKYKSNWELSAQGGFHF